MKKEWKIINNCNDYAVSNYGEVKSAKKLNKEDKKDFSKWKTIKPRYKKEGYTFVSIFDNDGMLHQVTIHRLVAIHFIPNPYDLPLVNHKDEIKDNNRVDNLEWCDYKYNNNYGKCSKKIYSFTDNMLFLSASACAEFYHVAPSTVIQHFNGKGKLPKWLQELKLVQCNNIQYIEL